MLAKTPRERYNNGQIAGGFKPARKLIGAAQGGRGKKERPLPGVEINPVLVGLGKFIYYGSWVYLWLVILRVGLTWINPNPYSPLMRFLSRAADPVLNRARRVCPLILGGLDFSPLLALIVIRFSGAVLGMWLWDMGRGAPPAWIVFLVASELLQLLHSLTWLLIIIMAIRLLMSLTRPSPYNLIVQLVYGLTEPLLAPLRRFFPLGPGGLDFRPLVFLLILLLLEFVVLGSLGLALKGLPVH